MARGNRKQERTWEVTTVFEPSRLARDHLAEAYQQVAPPLEGRRIRARAATMAEVPDTSGTGAIVGGARP